MENLKLILTNENSYINIQHIAEIRRGQKTSSNNAEVRLVGETNWIEVNIPITQLTYNNVIEKE
ncbi:MAG: hypothetical protein ABI207_05475 [Crocinitomicaceae bacterium]